MRGASLFEAGGRKILVRDLSENKSVYAEILKYLDTVNEVILLESKLDKRSATYKEMVKAGVEFREFKLAVKADFGAVFEVYKIAKKDGARAVAKLREIEPEQDPMMFFGLLVSQAMKDYVASGGALREKKVLKELSVLDMQMKTTKVEPWLLVESFLIRLSSL